MKNNNYVNKKQESSLPVIIGKTPKKGLDLLEIQKIRNILEQNGEKYTDEQIIIIHNFLQEMAELSVSVFLEK